MTLEDRIAALAHAVGSDVKALRLELDQLLAGGVSEVARPTALAPAGGAQGVALAPMLVGSAFMSVYPNASLAEAQYQVAEDAAFGTLVYDSGPASGIHHQLPLNYLARGHSCHWRLRYRSTSGFWSAWSLAAAFETGVTASNHYIPVPVPAPAPAFGAPLAGGYYAGRVWQELAQSSTQATVETGEHSFAVSDMEATPIVYGGQRVEIRSRANPVDCMRGEVIGAEGAALTVRVDGVSGAGSHEDWSIVAAHRIIVAPRSSGETFLALKTEDTLCPAASFSPTEGLRATRARVSDGNASLYPAPHWAASLAIGGYTDWYIPARDELELLWRNLKPVILDNSTGWRNSMQGAQYTQFGEMPDTWPIAS